MSGVRVSGMVTIIAFGFSAAFALADPEQPPDLSEQEQLRQEIETVRLRLTELEQQRQRPSESPEQTGREEPPADPDAAPAEAVQAAADDESAPDGLFTSGWDRGFVLRSTDDAYRLNIGGWIQPRYEYTSRADAENTSSFLMRRVRLDIRGHVFRPELTFRVMPEFARTANLRDAWIDYAFAPSLQVRAGQFTVPFQWHRFVSPRRQHFAERGVPSEVFGFPTGRDIGVMFHGRLFNERAAYGVGFFDGAGRNVAISNSDGNMASARLTWALLGAIPREESDYARSEDLQLAVGAGVQAARRNEARQWALGRSPLGNDRADWAVATTDARLAWQGFSLAAEGYLRSVDPQDPGVNSYDGWAYMLSAGYFIVPQKYELVARWSQLQLDRDVAGTRRDEWGAGVNIYHRGHDWKTRVNYLNDRDRAGDRTHTVLIEHHLQF